MPLSADAVQIINNALFVHEIDNCSWVENPSTLNSLEYLERLPESVLRRWCENLHVADVSSLKIYLAERGLQSRELADRFTPSDRVDGEVHAWPDILDLTIGIFSGPPFEIHVRSIEEAVITLAKEIGRRISNSEEIVRRVTKELGPIVAESVLVDLKDNLSERLVPLAIPTLRLELQMLVNRVNRPHLDGRQPGVRPLFISSSWWSSLLKNYPVLARHIAEISRDWAQNSAILLHRVQQDYQALANASSSVTVGKLLHITRGLSDPHHSGNSVVGLSFEQGPKWYYKPRSLGPDALHAKLLKWLDQISDLEVSHSAKILDCGKYGWMQEAVAAPCQNESGVESFYRKLGAHLCVAYIFNLTDLHGENIVADGCKPIVVDAETFLTPEFAESQDDIGNVVSASGREFWHDSVFRTAMMPRWLSTEAGKSDVNAAIQLESADDGAAQPHYHNGALAGALPKLKDRRVGAAAYVDVISRGFADCYGVFNQHKDLLLDDQEFWAEAATVSPRLVFRQTSVYLRLRQSLTEPIHLQSGFHASAQLDVLLKFHVCDLGTLNFNIIDQEQQALQHLDVPHFDLSSIQNLAVQSNLDPASVFRESAVTTVRERLLTLSSSLADRQVNLIRTGLAADSNAFRQSSGLPESTGMAKGPSSEVEWIAESYRSTEAHDERLIEDERRHLMVKCAESIWNVAAYNREGTPSWIGRVFHREVGAWRIKPLEADLYDGSLGTLLFLSAANELSGNPSVSRQGAIVRAAGEIARTTQLKHADVGLGKGIGGVIWGLAALCRSSSQSPVRRALVDLLDRCSWDDIVEHSTSGDILTGKAGLLLAGSSLRLSKYEIDLEKISGLTRPVVVAEAARCRQMLLEAKSLDGAYFGMAHGLSGHALALLHSAVNLDDEARIHEALSFYEFIAECHTSWSSLEGAERLRKYRETAAYSWCNGFIGSTLSLLAAYEVFPEPSLLESIASMLDALADMPPVSLDTQCCGNAGRIGLYDTAARILRRPELRRESATTFSLIPRVNRDKSEFRMGVPGGFVNPVLYQGLAGIGLLLADVASFNSMTWSLSSRDETNR